MLNYNQPVAVGEGRSRPTLAVKVNPVLSDRLLMGWPEGDELGKTLTALLHLLISAGRDLDLVLPESQEE